MKRIVVLFLIVVLAVMLCSCIDYNAVEKKEAEQVMAQQKVEKEAQEKQETLDRISELEKENEERLQEIAEITKQKEQLENDYDDLVSKNKVDEMQNDKYKEDLSFTLQLLEGEMKLTDLLKDIIVSDNLMGEGIKFEFVDALAVEYSEDNGTNFTFDRVRTEYLKKGYNPLSTFDIDDEGYYDDESYSHVVIIKETMEVADEAYVKINGLESFGFDEKSAKYLRQIVDVPKEEAKRYDWYLDDKKPDIDSDGNEVEEKRIYFIGIMNDQIVILMERGNK